MKKLALTTILALAAAAPAMADTTEMKFTGSGDGRQVRMNLNGNNSNVFAGQLNFELKNGTGLAAGLNGNQVFYCGDLTESVSSSFNVYTLVGADQINDNTAMGAAKATVLESLYAYSNGVEATTNSDDYACAFQLLTWEIITDYDAGTGFSSLDMTSGNFQARKTDGSALWSGVANQISTFINHLSTSDSSGIALYGLTNGSRQDQLVPMITQVPTAGTASLAAMGLLVMNKRRRRK